MHKESPVPIENKATKCIIKMNIYSTNIGFEVWLSDGNSMCGCQHTFNTNCILGSQTFYITTSVGLSGYTITHTHTQVQQKYLFY
jgi:hypothetical protein